MTKLLFILAVSLLTPLASAGLAELTTSELKLKKLLGDGTPDPIPLWPGRPPKFAENAPAEVVTDEARIRMISVPTISPYLPPKEKSTGMAVIVCAGGG